MRFGDEKWGRGPFGTGGGQVTWNFTDFRDSFNQLEFPIVQTAFRKRVEEAFDLWEAVLDIEFVQVASSARADIQMGFAEIDGPGGVLGQALTRFSGRRLERASIVMDIDEAWTADADFSGVRRGDPQNFFAVFAHELGHAIGLDHLSNPNTLMYPFSNGVTTLSKSDVRAGASLYGPNEGEGAPGRQVLVGLDDAERLAGGRGRDRLFGEGGDDRLAGGRGDDRLDGGRGADRLSGDRGDDRLEGASGDDWLKGGPGLDVLLGGGGADTFVLRRGGGHDRVLDFQDGQDRVQVNRDLDVTVQAIGSGAELRLEAGARLVLVDIDPDEIGRADFILV
ncbi:MAG: matrixin family metalloprotease [Pseudomonadota bacterium]